MPASLSRKIKLEIALFTLIRTIINSGYRMVYPLLPLFAAGMGVSLADMSLAFSFRSFLSFFSPLLSSLADTRGRKQGMLMGVGLFVLGCALTAAGNNFIFFVIGLSISALGNVVFIPSMQSYIGDHIPFERRGMVLSITELSWSLGFILGVPLLGYLVNKGDWTTPFVVLTGLGILLIGAILKFIPQTPPQGRQEQSFLRHIGAGLHHLPVILGLGTGLFFTTANEVVNLVFGVWIKDSFGLDFSTMAVASVVIGTSELGAELISVLVLDKIGKKRAIILSLLLNILSAVFLPLVSQSFILTLVGLALFYISFEFALISMMTVMSEVFPSARATVMALFLSVISIGRMGGALAGGGLYAISFWAVCLSSVVLNGLAILLIQRIKLSPQQT